MATPPQKVQLALTAKRPLTHDVWELDFGAPAGFPCQPGQFVMFTLAPAPSRAYSVAWAQPGLLRFVIKRVESGGGGSKAICDLPVGGSFPAMGPFGHFTLPEAPARRLFIGTGTGFAPLYFQARAMLEKDPRATARFLFGVREYRDMFYLDELDAWVKKYPNFSYAPCLSRQEGEIAHGHKGYVTDLLGKADIEGFEEFSICGSPKMVADARARLEAAGVPKEKIFFEQY